MSRLDGKITRWNSSYGFVRSGETDIFFHRSNVSPEELDLLLEGVAVSFEPEDNPRGPRAREVESCEDGVEFVGSMDAWPF